MDTKEINGLITQGYQQIESGSISNACMTCLRISRLLKDYLSMGIFLRDVSSSKAVFVDAFFDHTEGLKDEAKKFVYERSLEKWVSQRDLKNGKGDKDENTVFIKSIGEIESELQQTKEQVSHDYEVPPGMHPIDVAAFEDRSRSVRPILRKHIGDLTTILERSKCRCYGYLVKIESILKAQAEHTEVIDSSVVHVLNFFKDADQGVFEKLRKIRELAKESDVESQSLLLTEIRRAYKAVADYFYPPKAGMTKCLDGQERDLGEDRYLNRIKEYIRTQASGDTVAELLIIHAEYMDKVASKVNDLASKGVHSNVELREARQCLVSFYGFVHNLILHKLGS